MVQVPYKYIPVDFFVMVNKWCGKVYFAVVCRENLCVFLLFFPYKPHYFSL